MLYIFVIRLKSILKCFVKHFLFKKKKYALHPGLVQSKTDGQTHYINEYMLIDLYGLKKGEYVVWCNSRPDTFRGLRKKDFIHLYPRYDGDYTLKNNKGATL